MKNKVDDRLLFVSSRASVHFALANLEPVGEHLRSRSSFVTPDMDIIHWHEFGDLEGPGWGANAVGGAHLLYQWGDYLDDGSIQQKALRLLDHILEDGFIDPQSGFIYPYFDLSNQRFCLNYTHEDSWLCPGSLAHIGSQLLEFSDVLKNDSLSVKLKNVAAGLGSWLANHLTLLSSGWFPRRITRDGQP